MKGHADRNASLMVGNRLFERFGLIFQEKPPLVRVRSHEQASQDAGVVTLQEPNVQAVGQLSLWTGHESDNWHGTAQNGPSRLVEPVRDFTD